MDVNKIADHSDRLISLDYLRGYFIIVIIVDHLYRFPSAWEFITGRGLLWATAAEGFLMISGLMIGYVRGLKNYNKPFTYVASKLFKRSLLLYGWMVLGSLLYVALTWSLAPIRNIPWYNVPIGDWTTAINKIVTMQTPHAWVHFLYLYAIFLMLSIPTVWLLRKDQPWIVACLSIIGYIYGLHANIEWLRSQVIFFIPAIVGFYTPSILTWWGKWHRKKTFTLLIYAAALTTMITSAIYTAYEQVIPGAETVNALFAVEKFGIARVGIAALWFTALVLLFQKITPWLQKYTFNIVNYLGTHSLTAYVAHGLVLCAISLIVPASDNFFVNTFAGLAAVLGVYALIRLPIIQKILPR